ncbi:hypothetical protein ACOSP7_016272 [Xanthoceras sorbifolium]
MALIALLDYKIHHHIPRSKRRVLRGTCPPSGLMAQGTRPPRDMSTKWTLGPRYASSERHVHQVDSWSKAHPPKLPFPKTHVIRGTHLPSNGFASQVSSSKGIRPLWDASTEIM